MRKTVFTGVLLLFFLFEGCQLPTTVTPPKAERQWTVMIYMAADNDLQAEALEDLESMELVGSTEDVAVLVELDTGAGTLRYLVTRDENPLVLASPVLENLGRVNSGSAEALSAFIRFAWERYPANHYALVLWNHGSGVKGTTKDISFDFTARDSLTLPELSFALTQGLSGKKLDLLGMDACLMQMIEVAYEVKDCARVLVASQENVPGAGWDYESLLSALSQNPFLSPEALPRVIVSSYIDFYRQSGIPGQYTGQYTLSAVDLSGISELARYVDDLAGEILSDSTSPWMYLTLRDSAVYFGDPDFIDLGDFVRLLSLDPRVPQGVREKARLVLGELGECVLSSESIGIIGTTGLSIYFPYAVYEWKYNTLRFAFDTRWDDLIRYLMQWR
ncbi:MAG: clostripain-related cysteine peptidase [Candidatus Caldatribacteriaceae bacterium]